MKRIISTVLVCVLLVGSIFALASCGKMLSGKYELDAVVGGTSYEFKGNKVTVTFELLGFEKSSDGTYKIAENENGDTEITFTFESKDAEKYAGTFAFSEGAEDGEKYIKIAGVKYKKVN